MSRHRCTFLITTIHARDVERAGRRRVSRPSSKPNLLNQRRNVVPFFTEPSATRYHRRSPICNPRGDDFPDRALAPFFIAMNEDHKTLGLLVSDCFCKVFERAQSRRDVYPNRELT
jgi:hypothetical protein